MGIRERIIAACRELAKTRGLKNLTVDELAEQAGISKRTLYRYFRSKEEIVEATIEGFMNETVVEIDSMISESKDPPDLITHLINYLLMRGQFIFHPQGLHDLQRYYPYLWTRIDEFRTNRIITIFENLAEGGNLILQDGIDKRIAAGVVLASIQNIVNPEFILKNDLTFEDTIRQLSTLLKRMFILE